VSWAVHASNDGRQACRDATIAGRNKRLFASADASDCNRQEKSFLSGGHRVKSRLLTASCSLLEAYWQTRPVYRPGVASLRVPLRLALGYWRCLHSQGADSIHAVALRCLPRL